MIKFLIDKGLMSKVVLNKESKTCLHIAASTGFLDGVEEILKQPTHKVILEKEDGRGYTALTIAAGSGNQKVVNLLLENGANIRQTNLNCESAMHISARYKTSMNGQNDS